MHAVVRLPSALRPHAAGAAEVRVEVPTDATVAEVLAALNSDRPSVAWRLVDELGEVRPHVNLFVERDGEWYAVGPEERLRDGALLTVLPAVSGGAEPDPAGSPRTRV